MGEEILATGAGAEQHAVDQQVAWSARGNPAQMALLECSVFDCSSAARVAAAKPMACSANGFSTPTFMASMPSA